MALVPRAGCDGEVAPCRSAGGLRTQFVCSTGTPDASPSPPVVRPLQLQHILPIPQVPPVPRTDSAGRDHFYPFDCWECRGRGCEDSTARLCRGRVRRASPTSPTPDGCCWNTPARQTHSSGASLSHLPMPFLSPAAPFPLQFGVSTTLAASWLLLRASLLRVPDPGGAPAN
jgi:hypothetical protein